MTIYDEIREFAERHGELIEEMPSIGGKKRLYRLKNRDIIVIDTAPVAPEDIVVAILRNEAPLYLSPAGCAGLRDLTGKEVPPAPPEALRALLDEWKKGRTAAPSQPETLRIENDGPDIVETNYWKTEWADRGIIALSLNARTFRILLPDSMAGQVADMRTGKTIIISKGTISKGKHRGKLGYEVLFDDGTDSPYSLLLDGQQMVSPHPADSEHGREVQVSVWTRGPRRVLDAPARFRVVSRLPCLQPWAQEKD